MNLLIEPTQDKKGRHVLRLEKKSGNITPKEVCEALKEAGIDGTFILEINTSSRTQENVEEEGDAWLIYDKDDYFRPTWILRKKPLAEPILTEETNGKQIGTCPTCGSDVEKGIITDNYCRNCGQELNWKTAVDKA